MVLPECSKVDLVVAAVLDGVSGCGCLIGSAGAGIAEGIESRRYYELHPEFNSE